jgi:Fe-S-cluster-containing dehydrogenase component
VKRLVRSIGSSYNDKIAAEERISAHKLTTVKTHGERFSRRMCMHCEEPTCASYALWAHSPDGIRTRVYDENKCIAAGTA